LGPTLPGPANRITAYCNQSQLFVICIWCPSSRSWVVCLGVLAVIGYAARRICCSSSSAFRRSPSLSPTTSPPSITLVGPPLKPYHTSHTRSLNAPDSTSLTRLLLYLPCRRTKPPTQQEDHTATAHCSGPRTSDLLPIHGLPTGNIALCHHLSLASSIIHNGLSYGADAYCLRPLREGKGEM
jgi:hypothetical protein